MQEKQDEEKSMKPQLLILYVGRISLQQLLDISVEYLTKNIDPSHPQPDCIFSAQFESC